MTLLTSYCKCEYVDTNDMISIAGNSVCGLHHSRLVSYIQDLA